MKKAISLFIVACILLSITQVAFAKEAGYEPGAESSYSIPIDESEENVEIVYDRLLRGDDPPTDPTDLPYTLSGNIKSYTYGSKYFKPSSIGKIHTQLTGTTYYTGNVRVIIELYDSAGNFQTDYDCGRDHRFDMGISWYNLNPNTDYYYKVRITNKDFAKESFKFKLKCTAQNQ